MKFKVPFSAGSLDKLRKRAGYFKRYIKYKKDSVFKGTTTPDQTLKAGIGNCVDKSLLSKAMLDAIHIPNRLVLKYNSKEPEAHIFNQIVYNGQWTDFDTSCNTCTIGRTFSNNWETIAVISNKDTFIFNRKIYKELMEA